MMLHRASRYALSFGLLTAPAVAGAQAFGLNEIGTCAIARGFAVTAAPCADASSIYWNPGAMPAQNGITVSAAATIISVSGDFTRDSTHRVYDSETQTEVPPDFFFNWRNGRFAYGLGVFVPYGLTSEWGDEFPGRFSSKKASLHTVYIQPNISYAINKNWSVGIGPVIGHSSVELIQALDLSAQVAQPGVTFGSLGVAKYTEFGRATLKGSAMAYGVDLGFHGNITPHWQVGGRFLSQLVFSYDDANATFAQTPTGLILAQNNVIVPGGASAPVDALLAAQFAPGGALVAQGVSTEIAHPAQAQLGFAYTGLSRATLSADYAWTGWKSFRDLPVAFQGPAASSSRVLVEEYNNTSALRLGAEYRLRKNEVRLRAGFTTAGAAAPAETVTPLLPDMHRELAMFGVGVPFAHAWMFDAAYSHVFTPGRRGRTDEPVSGAVAPLALNNGAYTLSANIWSFGLRYNQ